MLLRRCQDDTVEPAYRSHPHVGECSYDSFIEKSQAVLQLRSPRMQFSLNYAHATQDLDRAELLRRRTAWQYQAVVIDLATTHCSPQWLR